MFPTTARTTSPRSCFRTCSRWDGRSTASRWTATGRTLATSTSTARRTWTRSRNVCACTSRASGSAATSGSGRASSASPRLFGRDGVAGLVNVDLTPETAVRIAAALGTALPRGARVVASRESAPACRMIKRAMISGFTSTGIDVADLRVIPASVSRHLLKSENYDAGVHVGTSQVDSEVVQIRFFEPPGITLTSGVQKELEKNFTR